jgi:hypothetical protein
MNVMKKGIVDGERYFIVIILAHYLTIIIKMIELILMNDTERPIRPANKV